MLDKMWCTIPYLLLSAATVMCRHTVNHLFLFLPVLCILLCHTNHLHVLSYHIYKPPLRPLSFLLAWSLYPHHLFPNILTFSFCPNQHNHASLVLSPNCLSSADPLIYSFLIPNANRNIFYSATSSSASCHFISATISIPYNIAGLTSVV